MKHIKLMITFLLLIAVSVILVLTLYVRGYKSLEEVTYTEQEIKEIAAELTMQCILVNPSAIIRVHDPEKAANDSFIPAYVIPYRDVGHFFSENPDCCQIRGNTMIVQSKVFYHTPAGEIHYGMMGNVYFYLPSFRTTHTC